MIDTADLFALLDARRAELGLSQAEVGRRAFGQADGSVLQNIKRGSSPSFEKLQRLCEVLGLDISLSGQGKKQDSLALCAPVDEFVQVPLYNAKLAAGLGYENARETVIDSLAFRRDWMRKIGVTPSCAVLARVEGDSMQPTIWAGDLVLIDRAKCEIPVRKFTEKSHYRSPVYAVLDDGKARVKRIERPADDHVMLISDNPDYGPQLAKIDTLGIIGKVMWWGHTNRE